MKDKMYYLYAESVTFTHWLHIIKNTKILNSNGFGLLLCEDK
jgi:hypothetical protein